MVGRVTEQPDGTLVYTEPINDKPWYDPYPETPDWKENLSRSTQRAYARQQRAETAINEYRREKERASASRAQTTPRVTSQSHSTSSEPAAPKRSFFSRITGRK